VERELMSAAEAVLVRDGPGGLTVRAVAAQAGIAPMGVYSRLGGKDGLLNALLIRGFDRLRAALDAGEEPAPLERVLGCGRRYREFALENPDFYAIMFERAAPREPRPDEVGQHSSASFEVLLRDMRLAAAAGLIGARDPAEAAQQVWSAAHGAVALERKGLVRTPDPAATYAALLDTLIRGITV
jgi:AcrR family transcriptional regulator